MRKMFMDKSREGRTLMIADERTALPAGARCDAGKWESDGRRKSGLVGAGNDDGGRAMGKGL